MQVPGVPIKGNLKAICPSTAPGYVNSKNIFHFTL
jgi:hypothetical protein